MMNRIALGFLLALLSEAMALPGNALAQEEQPQIEWNDSTRLALAQCYVAEAGWRNYTEHSAMAHVLERRWRMYNAAHPDAPITFEQEVRQYCHVHRVEREESSNGWALGLTWGPLDADPRQATDPRPMCIGDDCWRRYASRWDVVRESVLAFERGELADPMPLAILWGGTMDSAGSTVVSLGPHTRSIVPNENGEFVEVLLLNRFYARRSAIASAARRRARQ